MSHSSEDDCTAANQLQHISNKKRRVQNQRACDRCRLKKSPSLSLGIYIAASHLWPSSTQSVVRLLYLPSSYQPFTLQLCR